MPANRKFEAHGRAERPSRARRAAGFLGLLPRRAAVLAVRAYQRLIAPWLPAVFGANAGCRFYPSCSHYAVEALERHGFVAGVYLAARRLLRCQPLHPGGVDPVPEQFRWLPPSERRLHLFAPATSRRATPHHG